MKRMILINLFFAFAISISVQAQKKTKPYMWVDRNTSEERQKAFKKVYKMIPSNLGIKQDAFIWYPGIFQILKSLQTKHGDNYKFLRVYLALTPAEASDPEVPKGWGNKIMLIFAPAGGIGASGEPEDLGDYYCMRPNVTFDKHIDEIPESSKKIWTGLYIDKILPHISTRLDDIEENKIGDVISDTRSIRYLKTNWQELINELSREHFIKRKPAKITGMKACFAAYTNAGTGEFGCYPLRLHIEFEFTNDKGDIIYLEDDKDDQFSHNDHPFEDDLPPCSLGAANNGHLCPANCPK